MLRLAVVAALALTAAPALAGAKPAEPAATIGSESAAKWTETTVKAAATPEQQAQLKNGKPATVIGEVIDVSCYAQLGKRGEKHIACGTKCIQNGQPVGLLDDEGNVYTLFVEQHDPRRDGQVDLKSTFLPLLAKRVKVSGMLVDQKTVKALYVDSAALAAPAAAPAK